MPNIFKVGKAAKVAKPSAQADGVIDFKQAQDNKAIAEFSTLFHQKVGVRMADKAKLVDEARELGTT